MHESNPSFIRRCLMHPFTIIDRLLAEEGISFNDLVDLATAPSGPDTVNVDLSAETGVLQSILVETQRYRWRFEATGSCMQGGIPTVQMVEFTVLG